MSVGSPGTLASGQGWFVGEENQAKSKRQLASGPLLICLVTELMNLSVGVEGWPAEFGWQRH